MSVINVTKNNYDEIANSETAVLLDFYADWCGPCRMVSPIVDEIAKEYPEYTVGKINVDNEPELAEAFGIKSIPAVMYIPLKGDGVMTVGFRDKAKFEKEIATYLL